MREDSIPVFGNYVGVKVSVYVAVDHIVEGAKHVVAGVADSLNGSVFNRLPE